MQGDTTHDGIALPPYKGLDDRSETWTECNDHDRDRPNLDPKSSDSGPYTMEIALMPKVNGMFDQNHSVDWKARIMITTTDLPRLMRKGFHWSEANVRREWGCIRDNDINSYLEERGWVKMRHYTLEHRDQDLQWSGSLTVFARTIPVLSGFRISDLSPDLAYYAWATNPVGRLSYHYSARDPQDNFNAIYDDMPMEGWWPWPRAEKDLMEP